MSPSIRNPGTFEPHPPTSGRIFVPSKADYMSKRELVKLYWACGEYLHRGNYEGARKFLKIDLKPIRNAALKIVALLNFHKISFLGSDDEMWVTMVDPTDSSKVTATLERPIRL